ncbi:hypothetical protein BDR06DRAFT_969412 [Suillus hirtellus]|nr:hypothetical protein BDR06DRAFT_969412 [Suillus hirtellus]
MVWTSYLASRAVLQPCFTKIEAALWEDDTMSMLLHQDPRFSLMQMCHQQEAMNVLLQGVAKGFVLKGLLDQLFEDIMPLALIDDENAISYWSCEAEENCLRWRIAFTNFFSQGTQKNHLEAYQELEAPAITALQEMRKWTRNPSITHKSRMEFAILCSGLGHEILWIANPQYLHFHLRDASWLKLFDGCYQLWLPRPIYHMDTQGCHTCYDQPEDSKCVRYWTVEPGHHFEFHGKVITPYQANDPDRLPSIGKSCASQTNYVPLMHLGLRKISCHADVLERCGRDMTLLVDISSPSTILAGVSFDTFSHVDLQKICCDASAAKETKTIKHGSKFSQFEWGRMHPVGSRKPAGGRPGDTYMSYAGMEVTDTAHIKLLFAHATHMDRDATWTISLQTCKEAPADEFNFVMMDLGCYVETAENALWLPKNKAWHVPHLKPWLKNGM